MLTFAKITLPIASPLKPPKHADPTGSPGPPLGKGGSIRPSQIANLMLWLKGNGLPSSGQITNWNDASVYGRNATWDGDGNHPTVGALTGHNTCDMPSGAGGMTSSAWSFPISSNTTFSMYGVFKVATNVQLATLYKSSNLSIAAAVSIDTGLNLVFHSGAPQSNLTVVANTWFVFVWRQNAAGGMLYLNGSSFIDSTTVNNSGLNSLWLAEGVFGSFSGSCAEIAVWDADIGASNAAGLLRYARGKFKIRF